MKTRAATRPAAAPAAAASASVIDREPVRPLAEQVAALERQAIAEALRRCGGKRTQAARLLGMPRSVFYDRLQRWPYFPHVSGRICAQFEC